MHLSLPIDVVLIKIVIGIGNLTPTEQICPLCEEWLYLEMHDGEQLLVCRNCENKYEV